MAQLHRGVDTTLRSNRRRNLAPGSLNEYATLLGERRAEFTHVLHGTKTNRRVRGLLELLALGQASVALSHALRRRRPPTRRHGGR